jgi:hypothetical protein
MSACYKGVGSGGGLQKWRRAGALFQNRVSACVFGLGPDTLRQRVYSALTGAGEVSCQCHFDQTGAALRAWLAYSDATLSMLQLSCCLVQGRRRVLCC